MIPPRQNLTHRMWKPDASVVIAWAVALMALLASCGLIFGNSRFGPNG